MPDDEERLHPVVYFLKCHAYLALWGIFGILVVILGLMLERM
jgi:hypothetical protein